MRHILKYLFNRNYREATKLANKANQLVTEMMMANGAVRRG